MQTSCSEESTHDPKYLRSLTSLRGRPSRVVRGAWSGTLYVITSVFLALSESPTRLHSISTRDISSCAWEVELERRLMSSAKSRSVRAIAGYRLDLLGVSVNPRSISCPLIARLRAKSRTTMNTNGARVSPCMTPAKMSNSSVFPSGVTTLARVPEYID